MPVEKLFEPLTFKNGVTIKNRLYKGAMSEGMADKTHRPTVELINTYKRWADGGIGISITGNVMIDRRYLGEPGNVVVEDERDLDILKDWAEAGRITAISGCRLITRENKVLNPYQNNLLRPVQFQSAVVQAGHLIRQRK